MSAPKPTPGYRFDECQRCGAGIGLIGRLLQAVGISLHRCPADREAR